LAELRGEFLLTGAPHVAGWIENRALEKSISIGESLAMGTRFTRRQFLAGVGTGATYFALANAVGCEPSESRSKTKPAPNGHPTHHVRAGAPGSRPSSEGGAWAFRSRPDLSPPIVEVAKEAHDTASGYIFIAPEQGGAGQGGSLMIDNKGQVVWFRPLRSASTRAMDFRTQTYKGESVLTWIESFPVDLSEYVILDSSYHEIARFTPANGYVDGDHHEFLITPEDTALITTRDTVPRDLTSVGGSSDSVASEGIVQELDIETGKVLFEWHSLDHVGLDETYGKPGEDKDYSGIDYFHLNSIDVDHDNNLLVSARKTSAVYKIDRNSGEIIWRLGGKQSDFEMGPGTRFAFQHDARRLPDGTISIFDNGTTVIRNSLPIAIEVSRDIVLELDEEQMRASLVREYTHPDELRADAAGNAQELENGNVFVGWGRALAISEFSHDGMLLFDLRLQPENRSYRAFRLPWSGHPSDRPAAVAERTSEREVRVYASWNGATEVASWEVLVGPHPGKLKSLGSMPRDGFETAMVVRTSDPYVAVRAKDRSGRVLGTSKAVEPGG
jgi:outer membrane protein assembly factor BamB